MVCFSWGNRSKHPAERGAVDDALHLQNTLDERIILVARHVSEAAKPRQQVQKMDGRRFSNARREATASHSENDGTGGNCATYSCTRLFFLNGQLVCRPDLAFVRSQRPRAGSLKEDEAMTKSIKRYVRSRLLSMTRFLFQYAGNDLPVFTNSSSFRELEKIAYRESAQFIADNIEKAVLFTNDARFWTHALEAAPEKGLILEFGVFHGRSINIFADVLKAKGDARKIYGFDSFEGLSEDFTGTTLERHSFSIEGRLPEVAPSVVLKKGWVDQTLPEFVKENDDQLAFMNVDMDTYTPTKVIFENLMPRFQEGTIIVFDELVGFPGWKAHEYRVLIEMMAKMCEYEFISFCDVKTPQLLGNYIKAAVIVTKIK